MEPLFSICVPTYNRADLLDHCLTNLVAVESFNKPFELVVSDNASTDHTPDVIARHQARKPYMRSCRQSRNVGVESNWLNALRQARGRYLLYVADDDAIYPDNLNQHLTRLVNEPDILALYTDWVAYDDDKGQELHRNLRFPQPALFGPNDPLALINFVLQNQIYPEVGIYQRESFLQSHCFVKNGIPFHLWMYRQSRKGRIVFDALPFYQENRVLKPRFRRDHWANMDNSHQYIGDPLRNTLETIVLWAFQDSGATHPPAEQIAGIKMLIDRFLHNRTLLEIQRACASKNWHLALELRRRLVLWYGPGPHEQQVQDIMGISIPAACQAIQRTYVCLTQASGLFFQGFQSQQIQQFFRTHYPEIPIIEGNLASLAQKDRQPLVVHRTIPQDPASLPDGLWPGFQLVFDQLLSNYRVNSIRMDVGQL